MGIITDTDFVEVSIHLLEQLESGEQLAEGDIGEGSDADSVDGF